MIEESTGHVQEKMAFSACSSLYMYSATNDHVHIWQTMLLAIKSREYAYSGASYAPLKECLNFRRGHCMRINYTGNTLITTNNDI